MVNQWVISSIVLLIASVTCTADDTTAAEPNELAILKASVGIWDAEIEVWPHGPNESSIKFKGVETTRAYGKHWLASDFDSEFAGQTTKVHSIVGYDLGKKQLVGTVIDHGPYSATMIGNYDKKSKTVHWTTHAKDSKGKPVVQRTTVTHKDDKLRVLVLSVPEDDGDKWTKFMKIRFVKRD